MQAHPMSRSETLTMSRKDVAEVSLTGEQPDKTGADDGDRSGMRDRACVDLR